MPSDERAELAAGVAAGAEDADRDPIHDIMHNHAHAIGGSIGLRRRRLVADDRLRASLADGGAMTNKQRSARPRSSTGRRARRSAARRSSGSCCSARGMDVTQATLSRDLRDLRLARVSDGRRRPVRACRRSLAADDDKPLLATLLTAAVLASRRRRRADRAPHGRRAARSRSPRRIDGEEWPEVLGTIAGDDTILIVTRSAGARVAAHRAAARRSPARAEPDDSRVAAGTSRLDGCICC